MFRENPKRIGKNEVIVRDDFIAVDADLFWKLETPIVIVKHTSGNDIVIQECVRDSEWEAPAYVYDRAVIIPTSVGKNLKSGGYRAQFISAENTPKFIFVKTTLRSSVDRVLPDPVE